MKAFFKRNFHFLALVAFSIGCSSEPDASESHKPQVHEDTAAFALSSQVSPMDQLSSSVQAALTNRGYGILEGRVQLFTNADCAETIKLYGSCFAQNPAAPYIAITHQLRQGEYEDPYYGTSVNHTKVKPTRLGKDEVMLVFGYAPPKAGYLGFNTYHFSAPDTASTIAARGFLGNLMTQATPNPDRMLNFALIANSVNNAVIERSIGNAWGELFVIASSPNRSATEKVKAALVAANPELANRFFVEELSSEASYGLGKDNSDFLSFFRYALPQDSAAADVWKAHIPLAAMRVILPTTSTDLLYGPFVRDGVSANSEDSLRLPLLSLQNKVAKALADGRVTTVSSISTMAVGVYGENCLKKNIACNGDSGDTDSYRFMNGGLMEPDDVWAIVGVNHTRTNNASYVSLAVMNADDGAGVASVSESLDSLGLGEGALDDSANAFLPGLLWNDLKTKYYVHLFARDCSGLPKCTQISETGVSLDKNIMVIQRAYLRPGTLRGADWTKLVGPVMLKFKR